MAHKLADELLIALYAAMREPAPNVGAEGARIMRDIGAEGWAHSWRVEDLVLMTDRRLDNWRHRVDLGALGAALGYHKQGVCLRPDSKTSGVSIHDAWSAFDAAALFITLEMMGFAIDPTPLIQMLKPTIPKSGYISRSALEVLWYDKTRERSRITLEREDSAGPIGATEQVTLRGDYKVVALLDRSGKPIQLTISGPRYRKPRAVVETTCDECGHTWWRGEPESSALHRREHKLRMLALAPSPDPRMQADIAAGGDYEHVDWLSPLWKHEAMYRRALAFKREFGYDFVQWESPDRDPLANGFLFTSSDGAIVGACAFRWREFEDAPASYGLQWIWIAPSYRRRGIFRARWPSLRERFGDFYIEPPVSPAMKNFARNVGDQHLLTYPSRRSAAV